MNADEYDKLLQVETRHWFYSGKREIARYWLQRGGSLGLSDLLIDCGAGTGKFVEEMSHICRAMALDDHLESLAIAGKMLGADRVIEGRCTALPFPDNSLDALTALDVLEHVDDDQLAVEEFHRVLKPGGRLVITVPALPLLWSDWDVVLHHHRRYTKTTLLALLDKSSFQVIHWNYINVVALPAVWLIRKLRYMADMFGFSASGRVEDSIPPAPLNGVLRWIFVKLACQTMIRFPAGVGLLGVWRKPGLPDKGAPP